MLRAMVLAAALCAITESSQAQQIMDDTAGAVPESTMSKMMSRLDDELSDGAGSRLRDLVEFNGWVCGRVNSRNRFGAFTGYRRFVYNGNRDEIFFSVDPDSSAARKINNIITTVCGRIINRTPVKAGDE